MCKHICIQLPLEFDRSRTLLTAAKPFRPDYRVGNRREIHGVAQSGGRDVPVVFKLAAPAILMRQLRVLWSSEPSTYADFERLAERILRMNTQIIGYYSRRRKAVRDAK